MQEIEIQCVPSRSAARNPKITKIGTIRCWAAPVADDVVECEGLLYTVTSRSWVSPYLRSGGAVTGIDSQADRRLVLTCTKVGADR
jgi:hypothetical protein